YFSNHLFHPRRPSVGETVNHIWMTWEPMFFFAQTGQPGKSQIMRTDLLEFGFSFSDDQPTGKSGPHINYIPGCSLASPIFSQGGYINENISRIAVGRFKIWGNAALLEPCFYYHDFFVDMTPGVRLCVNL
ncbi:MAG: hypothetical protein Q8932_19310, partial [Bacteroidota bacterium]|nr:hypothetical protein [Bacteroidota bacterium]